MEQRQAKNEGHRILKKKIEIHDIYIERVEVYSSKWGSKDQIIKNSWSFIILFMLTPILNCFSNNTDRIQYVVFQDLGFFVNNNHEA